MRRIPDITSVIAKSTWHHKKSDGSVNHSRIIIGRPRREKRSKKNSDWVCPVFIEGVTPKVCHAMGVGSVDSLMNALTLVKSFFDSIRQGLVDITEEKK